MCGILGRVNRYDVVNQELFLKQLNTLNKRGPDTFGTEYCGRVALGHRRLSIIDLSEKGNQPMFNESGSLAVIFNGEIYNYKSVLDSLPGTHVLNSASDTEALLHGYEDFGKNLIKRIEGMFAFCIYDRSKEQLFLARDHFGKKPLYYYLDDNVFIFASEIKAIVADPYIRGQLDIDNKSLIKFLYYGYVPSTNSVYKQIHKLRPSHSMVFDINTWSLVEDIAYWTPQDVVMRTYSEEEIISTLDDLIEKAVKKRLISDVPLGIFLSGGVDSSLVAHYLAQYANNLTSYTVCYEEDRSIDESEYARFVAQKYGFKYNLVNFDPGQVQVLFKGIYDYLDEPLADSAIVPLYFISRESRKDLTVVLSGDGGDELFAGYPKYIAQKYISENTWADKIVPHLTKLPFSSSLKRLFAMYPYDFAIRQFVLGSGGFLPGETGELLASDVETTTLLEIFEDAMSYNSQYNHEDLINRGSYLDTRLQLPDWYLVKSDRATMANSQELRSPLLDKALAEYAFSVHGFEKIRGGTSKYLLKKLAGKYFPKNFVRRKKRGFGVPMDKWIRSELKDMFYDVCLEDTAFFNKDSVKKLLDSHVQGKSTNGFKLLRIFSINYILGKHNV
ncbi:MAG: hypothetical protein UW13_C0013G0007 [candidate division WWE3 bacterium GW2011_GWA1_43_94]|uniref:asparagine synthase (glutamine-hydrolyzing) n=1 Tax=candidate division WWE3 bacterium TaxID=2053526 RepID=A0A3D0ZQT8_UNCKA|nr:MAG: hypothetical protein US30_C0021G0005 [Candidatus Moranbacteria bacterium GW2011_GWF2_36_839]KKS28830.1 MAG: hypothetical protein UU91_C0013G0007 [candidate division WWE3 bacterium GW2011_GWB1_42_117]KKT26500.1 MAG: hypothetical protein UW13_C0013G0007 [candidate division WWE3 bacterium GW2011_GWA1_43_94]OGC57988.1 MAG: asparagine synthase (glutamine-hydrolyzing) [candidate division WWE3 bacterium RIFOXYA2_FULL_43_12]OGC75419.1 MAG: asparagine synthase (glutamine-hydrolyzing) [candidate 